MNKNGLKITTLQFESAVEALEQTLTMEYPADGVLHHYFRANAKLGQKERAFVAETVFGVLRHRYGIEYAAASAELPPLTPTRYVLAYLRRAHGLSVSALDFLMPRADDKHWLEAFSSAANQNAGSAPLYVKAELPEWLTRALQTQGMHDDDILALGRTLQTPAPLDLRVNTLLATREDVLAHFAQEEIAAHATPYSPIGIRLENKLALNKHPLFTSGKIEVQDEGSQLLCFLLAPKRREMVADFCAGAGGKTLALGAMMQSQGRLYAFDISERRLEKLKPRLKRSGLSNVQAQRIAHERDAKIKRLAGKFDRVLVDAPCSGFGTLRRNPDLKWRQPEAGVLELVKQQQAILESAATLVKPGGRLVYATCSILNVENQEVVEAFRAAHSEFKLLSASEVLASQNIHIQNAGSADTDSPASSPQEYLQLLPNKHGCDGFFAAVMERQ